MRSNILILIWRRKLSLLLFASTLILIALWSWAIYNSTYIGTRDKFILIKDNTNTKHEYFLQRLISQANQIIRNQRQPNTDSSDIKQITASSIGSSKYKKSPPAMENNPFEEERLRIIQQKFEKNDDNVMDYERILSSSERQLQYEHELQKIGVPIISGIGPDGPRPPHERLVHLDLKGAPPKLSFLKRCLPVMKTLGATGLLIEYEDMFPYTGSLQMLAAKNAYNAEELKDFLETAIQNGLTIMPLVQTFGHLEYALKLEGFQEMRELPENPQSICPSQKISMLFLQDMITQIVEFHLELNKNSSVTSYHNNNQQQQQPVRGGASSSADAVTDELLQHPRRKKKLTPNFTHLHIGCDEVYRMGECDKCRHKSRNELFLSHVTSLASFIREKWPDLKPIIWDDMLRDMTLSEMQHSQIGSYVEPMIWVYINDIYHFIQPQLWDMYSKVFPTAWAASAFKGAFGETLMIPPIQRHLENNIRWLAVIAKEGGRFAKGFRGLALTGWQRYDHFATLCELFPIGIPSLITSLSTVSKGYFSVDPKDNIIMNVLECPVRPDYRRSGHAWIELQLNSRHSQLYSICAFPGSFTYTFILRLAEKFNEIQLYLTNVRDKNAWMSDYNVRHNFSSPIRVRELTAHSQSFINDLTAMTKECQTVMFEIFDEYTINEFIEQYIYPVVKELHEHIQNGETLLAQKVWPRRPLPYSQELVKFKLIPGSSGGNNN